MRTYLPLAFSKSDAAKISFETRQLHSAFSHEIPTFYTIIDWVLGFKESAVNCTLQWIHPHQVVAHIDLFDINIKAGSALYTFENIFSTAAEHLLLHYLWGTSDQYFISLALLNNCRDLPHCGNFLKSSSESYTNDAKRRSSILPICGFGSPCSRLRNEESGCQFPKMSRKMFLPPEPHLFLPCSLIFKKNRK